MTGKVITRRDEIPTEKSSTSLRIISEIIFLIRKVDKNEFLCYPPYNDEA
jgi:hypothetical protein